MRDFNFEGLFIYDMANNHQGDLQHGLNIIRELGDVNKRAEARGALKFQFRNIETFIHPDYKERKDINHIPRFMSTCLTKSDYEVLTKAVRDNGMITVSTPFDEESIDLIEELEIEVIKVASCSASDRPLIERIAKSKKPVIASTAGLSLEDIDRLVNIFEQERIKFSLMHCVALYPTTNEELNFNKIEFLKSRYPAVKIGFSTHEEPDNFTAIKIAFAKGARLFERHVGIETADYKLNAYSSRPDQIASWIQAYNETVKACGGEEPSPVTPREMKSLYSLMRGVFAKKEIEKGRILNREDVFFAMPLLDGKLRSGMWRDGVVADKDYCANEPIIAGIINLKIPKEEMIYRYMLIVKGMLNKANIFLSQDNSIEISHHYGLEKFREFGVVIINCINRSYCKKLMVQLPRQKHPYHYHKKKEESFQLLYGDLEVTLDGKKKNLKPGDIVLVEQNRWHKFHTLDGAVFEEVSSTHYNNDSFYHDEGIIQVAREKRKTIFRSMEDALIVKI